MNLVIGEDGRWVLGNPNARCRECGAPAAVHYAANGKAEVWHAPVDCCEYARARELRFGAASREDTHRERESRESAEARARRTVEYNDDGRVSK